MQRYKSVRPRTPVWLLLLLLPAFGQTSPPSVSSAEIEPAGQPAVSGSITGRVVNALTGEPLKKTEIRAFHQDGKSQRDSFTATTDVSGAYRIDDVEPGRYLVSASRNGFVRQSFNSHPSGKAAAGTLLTLAPGGSIQADFRLDPHSVITGKVVDEDGDPAVGIRLSISRFRYMNGKKMLLPSGSGITNDLGEYRVYGLAPGKYFVSATFNHRMAVDGTSRPARNDAPEDDYAPVYYPGATDPQGAVQVEVLAASTLSGIDFALRKVRTFHIQGRVSNNIPGGHNERVMVAALPANSLLGNFAEASRSVQTDGEGRFQLRGLTPGSYELMAQLWSHEQAYYAREEVSVGQQHVAGVSLNLAPGWEVKGAVKLESPDQKTPDLSNMNLAIASAGAVQIGMRTSLSSVEDDNTFTLTNVSPQNARLTVTGLPEGYYLKTARAGSQDFAHRPFDTSLLRGASLEIVLSANSASAEGAVHDANDQPVTNGVIVLVPDAAHRASPDLYATGHIDQYGHYKITGITPGSYSLFALQNAENGSWQDPDFLRLIEKDGVDVTLKESDHAQQDLKAILSPDF